MNSHRAYDSQMLGMLPFQSLGHHSNSVQDMIDQIALGIKEAIITEWDTWTIVKSFDVIVHDSLFHHNEHYIKKCEPLIVVHDISPEVSI